MEGIPLVDGMRIYVLLLTVVVFIFIYNLIKIFVDKKKGITKRLLNIVISLIIIVAMVINYGKVLNHLKDKGYLNTLNYKKVKEGLDNNTSYKKYEIIVRNEDRSNSMDYIRGKDVFSNIH